jgi:hypothetical protein
MCEPSEPSSSDSKPTPENTIELTAKDLEAAEGSKKDYVGYRRHALGTDISENELYSSLVQRWVNHSIDYVLRIRCSASYYAGRDDMRAPATHEGQQEALRPQLKDDHLNITLIKINGGRQFRYQVHNPLDLEYVVHLSEQQLRSKKQELTRAACGRFPQSDDKEQERLFEEELKRIDALSSRNVYPRDVPFLLNYRNARAAVKGLIDEYVWRLQGRYRGLGLARPVAFDAACLGYPLA